ncbi:WBSCR27 [Bugula neritina]|uniref:WBSCR27 n=1 Tax=Bugula neritina TaxID=10212 RepID=A0A7J7JJZ4_BUGNE|nr:WBSCR27 [Bugula neritina]
MLALARAKQLYKNTMEKFLYLNCGLEHDRYDGVVSSGTFVTGHMKSDCLIELCNILKPGGHLVITMRHEHLETVSEYKENFRLTIENLVKERKWKIIQDETFLNWCFGDNGMGIDGHVFVFQKNLMS